MACDICKAESGKLAPYEKDGKKYMICPDCMEREKKGGEDACRCKEAIGKTPAQLAKEVLKDLTFRKK